MRNPHIVRFVLVTALFLLAFAPFSARATAAGLNPPPPPGARCQTTGNGTVCFFSDYILFTGGPNIGTYGPISVFENQSSLFDDCGSFQIFFTFTAQIDGTAYYDQAGNLTLVREHSQFTGVLTTPGSTTPVSFDGNYIHTVRVQNGAFIQTIDGLSGGHLNLPGQGIVLLGAGTVTFDANGDVIHAAGPFKDQLCTALAPQ